MQRILIAGCGQLGCQLGLHLAAQGHSVFGLRRRAGNIPAPIHGLAADLTDTATLRGQLPPDLDAVVYLATPGTFEDEAYRQAYVVGMENLAAVLADMGQPVQRLILVSSTSVYGVTDGGWVNEATPAEPGGFSGRRLLEAEAVARQSPFATTVVRFGGIYGPSRKRMLNRVREQRPVVDEPPQFTNRIHQDDCVGVLAHLMQLPSPAPLYLGVDSAPCSMAELTDWLADTLGLPRPQHVSGDAGGVRGSNKRCDNSLLRASGYTFLYPGYRDGYGAMIAALRENQE